MAEAAPSVPRPAKRWFWINAGILCVLAPVATWWFQQHLQLYFTGIVIIGGAFSLWVFTQAAWGVFQKTTEINAWEYSRRLLALPDVTVVLIAAVLVLAILWRFTSSIYVTYEGTTGEGEYQVEVIRLRDRSPMLQTASLTAGNPVAGRPFFWQTGSSGLLCRILHPARYEVLPCELTPGRSTRIRVPGDFKGRDFHLLRIVPTGLLYKRLPDTGDAPEVRYDLQIDVGGNKLVLRDLRRQTVYTGANAEEMPIVMALEQPDMLENYLRKLLLARDVDVAEVDRTAAILSLAPRVWPTLAVRKGDSLTFSVSVTGKDGQSRIFDGFPIDRPITEGKVQTIWLPE